MLTMNKKELLSNEVLCTAQADNLKYDDNNLRVWHCRVTKNWSAETLINGYWESVELIDNRESAEILDDAY